MFETTVFSILGACALLLAAGIILAGALVWLGNAVCSCVWLFIDEGETPWVPVWTEALLIRTVRGERWEAVRDGDWPFYDAGSGCWLRSRYPSSGFEDKKEAEKFIEGLTHPAHVEHRNVSGEIELARHSIYVPILGVLGAGFLLIPVITLVAGCAMLSLYAMRWARRAFKRSKKVSEMLEQHVKDKDAHKE